MIAGQHKRGEHAPTEREKKPAYIGMIACTEKKYKKSKEKFGSINFLPYLCIVKRCEQRQNL